MQHDLELRDAKVDGWPSEQLHDLAKHELKDFLHDLLDLEQSSADLMHYVADDFRGSHRLRPQNMQKVYAASGLEVMRPIELDSTLLGRDQFAGLLDDYRNQFKGAVESFQDLAVDQGYLLVQGLPEVAPLPMFFLPGFAQVPTSKLAGDTDSSRRAVLADRLPLSNFSLPSYSNAKRKVADLQGGPVLINLWATTCANCFRELADFQTHATQLSAAGLRIVPMNTGPKEGEANARKKSRNSV